MVNIWIYQFRTDGVQLYDEVYCRQCFSNLFLEKQHFNLLRHPQNTEILSVFFSATAESMAIFSVSNFIFPLTLRDQKNLLFDISVQNAPFSHYHRGFQFWNTWRI